jgi:hypothetical protein
MEFKIGDIIVLNNCDIKKLIAIGGSNIKVYKAMNFRIKRLKGEQEINIETMCGTEIFGAAAVDLFRLATELEVKTYQMKNIFIKLGNKNGI